MLLVNRTGDKRTVRAHHETAHLGEDLDISHSCRNEDLVIHLVHTLSDDADIVRLLPGLVGNTDSARQIDKSDVSTGDVLEFYGKLEKHLGKLRIVFICDCVACEKSVDTEFLDTLLLQDAERLEQLIGCHAILGVSRVVHNTVGEFEQSARVIAAADPFRNISQCFLNVFDAGEVIQVDDGMDVICLPVFRKRRIV